MQPATAYTCCTNHQCTTHTTPPTLDFRIRLGVDFHFGFLAFCNKVPLQGVVFGMLGATDHSMFACATSGIYHMCAPPQECKRSGGARGAGCCSPQRLARVATCVGPTTSAPHTCCLLLPFWFAFGSGFGFIAFAFGLWLWLCPSALDLAFPFATSRVPLILLWRWQRLGVLWCCLSPMPTPVTF